MGPLILLVPDKADPERDAVATAWESAGGPSAVDGSFAELDAATEGLGPDALVIASDVVTFVAEARAFVLDGVVRACALYEGTGAVDEAARFAGEAARALRLPRTCVVDVGRFADGRWALIECNATWGAGLNGCSAADVVPCIAAAAAPRR